VLKSVTKLLLLHATIYTRQIPYVIINNELFHTADYYKHEIYLRIAFARFHQLTLGRPKPKMIMAAFNEIYTTMLTVAR